VLGGKHAIIAIPKNQEIQNLKSGNLPKNKKRWKGEHGKQHLENTAEKQKNTAAFMKKINLVLVVKERMIEPMTTLIKIETSDTEMNLSTTRGQDTHGKTKLVGLKNAIDMNMIKINPFTNSTPVKIE
jgi:hypothetical protein